MLASCWHCYLQASADFLSLQCCELGSFGRCSELREREARLLDHSQFQTKNKKDLTISFLSLKYFSCIPFVLSVNMGVALLLRSPSLKCTLNNCYFWTGISYCFSVLKWLVSIRPKKVQVSKETLHWQIKSHIRRHRDDVWCNFIFRIYLSIIFSC